MKFFGGHGRKSVDLKTPLLKAGVYGAGLMSGQWSHGLLETTLDDTVAIDYAIFNNFDFPFKNIVFEGGGIKGLAYVGALQVLEEVNILQHVKRIAGVSIGSLLAVLLYVGYSPAEIKVIMGEDLGSTTIDHRCGCCSLLPNLWSGFGWNPGKRVQKSLGEKIRDKTGNANSTFLDLYNQTGRELCIVVTNLNHMVTEYFHVKTTPNIPIALAAYISMAVPGLFQGRRIEQPNGDSDLYVDGGLLCNYPVHCYDGWFLSTKPEDSYFKKMSSMENFSNLFSKNERFGEWNEETLGMLLFANNETEVMKTKFARRQGSKLPKPPKESKRYRQSINIKSNEAELRDEKEPLAIAVQKLMEELKKIDADGINGIPLGKVKQALKDSDFGEEEVATLFGCSDLDDIIFEMDKNYDGEITFLELMGFIEKRGVDVHTKFLGYSRRKINTFTDFLSAIEAGLSVCLLKGNVEDRDFDRTIGINTGYIETTDFFIEEDDKMYLVECGAIATRSFLRDYCRKNPSRRSHLKLGRLVSHQFFANRGRNEHTQRFVQMMKEADEKIQVSRDVFETDFQTICSNGHVPIGYTKSTRTTSVSSIQSIPEADEDEFKEGEEEETNQFSNNAFETTSQTLSSNGHIPIGYAKSTRSIPVKPIPEADEDEVKEEEEEKNKLSKNTFETTLQTLSSNGHTPLGYTKSPRSIPVKPIPDKEDSLLPVRTNYGTMT